MSEELHEQLLSKISGVIANWIDQLAKKFGLQEKPREEERDGGE